MNVTRELYMQRMAQFEPPIHEIAHNNVIVNRVLEMYARFDIITKEEALSQMVVLLAKDWKQEQDRYVALVSMGPPPVVVAEASKAKQ